MNKKRKLILIDADVISHFIACGEILYLPVIFNPHQVIILNIVYGEIARIRSRRQVLDQLLGSVKNIKLAAFPEGNIEIKREYALIKKINPLIGDGERACMAVARFRKDVIASSNFRDIVPYCKKNGIPYLGTLDILALALRKGIFDEDRCNQFIKTARLVNHARFPASVVNIADYHPGDLSFMEE